ncbi:MAG: transcriptional repressor NrdR [Acidimicrobiaceae bacterium]|nr:transcriptional repressor NrdR [Acidimicrobiaceae bacterium]
MRCPYCSADDDRVVDSRLAEDGSAIRRRRECSTCNQRFTTFERIDEVGVIVVKRSGEREVFSRDKVLSGIRAACKNRPVGSETLESLVGGIEEIVRAAGRDVTSEEVGMATLNALRLVDDVAYLRFASVYKGFEGADDFAREVGNLVKATAPKSRS